MIKRLAYFKTEEVMNNYKIPILVGLRRTGKTTILQQLKKKYEKKAVIIRFDALEIRKFNLLDIKKIIEMLMDKGITIFLLDEVQAKNDWASLVKDLFDQYVVNKKIKVVVTGSSSLTFENVDTGVDRTENILISTLDFNEYCQLTNQEKTTKNFESFLGNGAFPEYVNKNLSFELLRQKTLEPIINSDIPSCYKISAENIARLLYEIATLSNGEFNKSRSSKNTGIAINQINNYLEILEKTQIIKKVYQVNPRGQVARYPRFKIYLNPHFHLWLLNKTFDSVDDSFKGHIIEAYWLFAITQIDGYYKRWHYLKNDRNQEVDFVSLNQDKKPIFKTLHEFKYTGNPSSNNLFNTTKAINKIIWYKGKSKKTLLAKYKNIIEFKKII